MRPTGTFLAFQFPSMYCRLLRDRVIADRRPFRGLQVIDGCFAFSSSTPSLCASIRPSQSGRQRIALRYRVGLHFLGLQRARLGRDLRSLKDCSLWLCGSSVLEEATSLLSPI